MYKCPVDDGANVRGCSLSRRFTVTDNSGSFRCCESNDFIGGPGGAIVPTVEHCKVRFQLFKMGPLSPK